MNKTSLSCDQLQNELDGIRNSSQQLSEQARSHLSECTACAAEWASHRGLISHMETARQNVSRVNLVDHVIAALHQPETPAIQPAPPTRHPAVASPWPVLAVAASLIFMILIGNQHRGDQNTRIVRNNAQVSEGNEVARVTESVQLLLSDVKGGYQEMAEETRGLVHELVPAGVVTIFSSQPGGNARHLENPPADQRSSLWSESLQKAWQLWNEVTADESSSS